MKKKIVVDIFGGDYAPLEIIKGTVAALNNNSGLEVILVGNKDIIKTTLSTYSFDSSRVEIVDAQDVITNDDVPTVAIKQKTESSLVKALKILKERPEAAALVSAGSTGAVLTGATLLLGRIAGIKRPALSVALPTIKKDKKVLMLDIGANLECKPEYLAQFAVMGTAYVSKFFGVKNPKVALLSNGAEEKKGTEVLQAAHKVLKQMPVNFVGNIEGRDILNGEYDVVVADGFSGNIAIKTIEGTTLLMFEALKDAIKSRFMSKFGFLFMKPSFKKMKYSLDYTRMGGAPFLGCKRVVIKCHGASKAVTIEAALQQAKTLVDTNVIETIENELSNFDLDALLPAESN